MIRKAISILCLFLSVSLISACSTSDDNLLSFTDNKSGMSEITSILTAGNSYRAELPGENTCIIPVKNETQMSKFPKDFRLNSNGALLVDIDKNEVILSKNIYERLYPASLTKLATALVCLKYGNLEDDVTVSYKASHLNEPGAKLCYLQEGDIVNFKVLLTSFIVYSGNDAGVALAEHISGSEQAFVELMNKELFSIGASDTHFVNSHGLPDDNHYTTVYDMYLLMNELLKYDVFTEIASIASYNAEFIDVNGKKVTKVYENTNRYMLGEKELPNKIEILASKTGTTFAAGSCLTLAVKGKNGHKYIAVLMKAGSSDILYDEMSTILKKTK